MQQRIVALMCGLLCLTVFVPYSTQAHAQLVESTPAANGVIAQAPATARLRFSEPLEASYSRVVLLKVAGGPVTTTSSQVAPDDPYALLLDLPTLAEGQYLLQWRTLSSVDGHTLEGVVPFAIGDPAAANAPLLLPPPPPDPRALPSLLDVALRWLTMLGLSLVVGRVIFGWLAWQPLAANDAATQQLGAILRRLDLGAALMALVGTIGMLILAGSNTGLGVAGLLSSSRVGLILGLRLVLALALCLVLWQEFKYRRLLALIIGSGTLLTLSLLSHSAAPRGQDATILGSLFTGFGVAFDFAHLLATAAWVGALPALLFGLLALRRNSSDSQAAHPTLLVARFTNLATAAVIVLVVTGSYAAFQQIGHVSELWTTTYGLALTLKLALFMLLLLLGGYNRWRLAPVLAASEHAPASLDRLRWSVRIEIAASAALLLIVGVLTSSMPAREALSQAAGFIERAALDDATITLQAVRGNIAGDTFAVDVGGLPAGVQPVVLVRASMPGHSMGEQEIQLRGIEPGRWGARAPLLTMQGAWNIEVIVRASGMNDLRHTFLVDTSALGNAKPPRDALPVWALLLVLALITAAVSQLPLHQRWQGRFQMSSLVLIGSAFIATTAPYYVERATEAENPMSATPERLAAGKQLYQQQCVTCHGDSGRGDGPAARSLPGLPSDFTQQHFAQHSDAEVFGWIKEGKPGTVMPAFGSRLSDEQIWQVTTYIRELYKDSQQP